MSTGPDSQNESAGGISTLRCTVTEAANQLGISKRAVVRQIQKGTLAAERDGGQWIVLLPGSTTAGLGPGQAASAPSEELAASSDAVGHGPEPSVPRQIRPQDQIEQAIERLGARHSNRLRALSQQIRQQASAATSQPPSSQVSDSPFERELESPKPNSAEAEQASPTAASSLAAPQLAFSAEPAEPATTAEQQWEALFRTTSDPLARTATPPISSQAGRPTPLPQTTFATPTEKLGWRERIDEWWQDLISRYAYRSRLIVAMLGVFVLLSALLGGVMLLLLYAPSRDRATGVFRAATARPGVVATVDAVQTQVAASATPGASSTASRASSSPAPAAAPSAAGASSEVATNATMPISTILQDSATDVLYRVAAAEAALRRGQAEARISNADGTGAWAQVRFDFGDTTRPPAFHITSIYTGTAGVQKVERITIGERSWERSPDGHWSARPAREGIADQVRVFLPHAASIANASLENSSAAAQLRWHTSAPDSNFTLVVDPSTGTPRELQQDTPSAGSVRVVTYSLWNTAVDIAPPQEE
jgi:excisionase family DNA binding protein